MSDSHEPSSHRIFLVRDGLEQDSTIPGQEQSAAQLKYYTQRINICIYD